MTDETEEAPAEEDPTKVDHTGKFTWTDANQITIDKKPKKAKTLRELLEEIDEQHQDK